VKSRKSFYLGNRKIINKANPSRNRYSNIIASATLCFKAVLNDVWVISYSTRLTAETLLKDFFSASTESPCCWRRGKVCHSGMKISSQPSIIASSSCQWRDSSKWPIDFQIKILDCVIARRRMAYTTSSLCLAKIIIWKSIE